MVRAKVLVLGALGSAFLAVSARAADHGQMTVAELQALMAAGKLTSVQLTQEFLTRIQQIDQSGPGLNSVIEVNPDALALARKADAERRRGIVRGPLHGIPVMLKDNIDTGDKMQTTAGSWALFGAPALQDSTVAANLRAGGAVILGKTNLSEWANFRSFWSTSGWSGRGGQAHNPYSIDRNPCGSSSGSAASVSAGLTAVGFGSETDGSIVCPGNANGVVAIKPTVGLTSRAGVVPISHTQDTVGPHGRTVADAATALGVAQSIGYDGRDPATGGVPLGWRGLARPTNIPTDYTQFLDPNGLAGKRIGITYQGVDNARPEVRAVFDDAVAAMEQAGATIVNLDAEGFTFPQGDGELLVLLYDFKQDLKAYFATRVGVPVAGGDIQTAIDFDNAHADIEMPFFGQELFEFTAMMEDGEDTPQPVFGGLTYNQALDIDYESGIHGIDAALMDFDLDAIAAPTDGIPWTTDIVNSDHFTFGTSNLAAVVGYPIVQVPSGNVFGLPVGISFFGTAFSEPMLITVASGFEAVTHARIVPTLAPSLPSTGAPSGGHRSHGRGGHAMSQVHAF